MPNVKNLRRLKEWLEAGAPHVTFDMHMGLRVETMDGGVGSCGTICCIAGAAYAMAQGKKLTGKDQWIAENGDHAGQRVAGPNVIEISEIDWFTVRDEAAKWLGLGKMNNFYEDHYGYPLFNPKRAPRDCTPDQAAEAVQRVIDGQDPWPFRL